MKSFKFVAITLALLCASQMASARSIYAGICKPTEGLWVMHTNDDQVVSECALLGKVPAHITAYQNGGPALYDRNNNFIGYYNPSIN